MRVLNPIFACLGYPTLLILLRPSDYSLLYYAFVHSFETPLLLTNHFDRNSSSVIVRPFVHFANKVTATLYQHHIPSLYQLIVLYLLSYILSISYAEF